MAATVTLNSTVQPILDTTQGSQLVRGTVAFTGSYPAGGDTLNLSAYPTQSAQPPVLVLFTETPSASVAPSGCLYYYQPGTTTANGLIRVTTAANTEVSAGAYPSEVLAANVSFVAIFPLGM